MRNYLENLFNYLAGDTIWCEEEGGHIESPTGHYALVLFPRSKPMREEMIRELENLTGQYAEDYPDEDTYIRPGWYVVRTDSSGFVHWQNYSTEEAACNAFDELEAEYAKWDEPNPVDYFDN